MPFQLPELSFSPDALAPHGMSEKTVRIHHDFHHKAYVDNGNKAIDETEWEDRPLDDIVTGTYQSDAKV